ncbi:MAG: FGGY family carbohydrate kinase [Verrucomicrobiota bacterium]|nr:FGGY family carbohydrate kinase [Verrucomicrobiota bacterium]
MARSAKALVLAMDIGSSSLRTALFNERGAPLPRSDASRKYSIDYTPEGGAELSPFVLRAAAKRCVAGTLRTRNSRPPVTTIAASAFWHGLLGLDQRGAPVTPVFMWADARSASDAAGLRSELPERRWQFRTGCMLRAPYWAAKLRWLRRTNPALFRRVKTWISPAAWIFRELFGVSLTSHSMASGTGLYNLKTRAWDTQLLASCHVRLDQLGEISDSASAQTGAREAKVFAAIGDGAASNLGSGADSAGKIALNIGTSAAVRTMLRASDAGASRLPAGLFRYVIDEEHFLVGGAVSNGGNLRQWCRRELQLRGHDAAEKALSRVMAANDPLTVLPFWVNERAPSWPEDLRGTISGLTPATSAADIFRGATTSVCYRLAQILEAVESMKGRAPDEIIVSGGVLRSPAALAILADSLGRDIRVCRELESSLRGAAIYALRKLGYQPRPLPPGRLVRHRPRLAERHRLRRAQQVALERRLT